jgi:hypothetical protein
MRRRGSTALPAMGSWAVSMVQRPRELPLNRRIGERTARRLSAKWGQAVPTLPTNLPLTPSLSPSEGEWVSEGRVRGTFWGSMREVFLRRILSLGHKLDWPDSVPPSKL